MKKIEFNVRAAWITLGAAALVTVQHLLLGLSGEFSHGFTLNTYVISQVIVERSLLILPIAYLLLTKDWGLFTSSLKMSFKDKGLVTGFGVNLLFNLVVIGLYLAKAGSAAKPFYSYYKLWSLVFMGLLTVAVPEELFYRGMLQNVLWKRLPAWAAIAAQAILFGGLHLMYCWVPGLGLFACLFSVGVGLIFGVIYYFTGNLWWTIWIHFMIDNKAPMLMLLALYSN